MGKKPHIAENMAYILSSLKNGEKAA